MKRRITRREFVSGMAVGLAAGYANAPLRITAETRTAPMPKPSTNYYPPSLTGMRGAHPGSFEIAHAISWQGQRRYPRPDRQTDQDYDLVVVGGGLSGLTAAWQFRKARPQSRILILENHDDFGGHAKRNEFDVDGRTLIGSGGSQAVLPSNLPDIVAMLEDIGFREAELRAANDTEAYKAHSQPGIYFDASRYGVTRLLPSPFTWWMKTIGGVDPIDYEAMISGYPLSEDTRSRLIHLYTADPETVFPGEKLNASDLYARLKTQSYESFLEQYYDMTVEGIEFLRSVGVDFSANRNDVESIMMARIRELPVPGFDREEALLEMMGATFRRFVTRKPRGMLHFPDGNAGVARLLVRDLIPEVAPAPINRSRWKDIVTASFDYAALDASHNAVRIRLNSLAVDVRHADGGTLVDVTYVKTDDARAVPHRVRARHVILACWNAVIPHLCPELGDEQKSALRYQEKAPLTYVNVALRNWRAIKKSGFGEIYDPHGFYTYLHIDFPTNMGDFKFARGPDEPVIVRAEHYPAPFANGLTAREQNRLGRHLVLALAFEDYEKALVDQFTAVWGPFGFDAERDIAGITVNRWPHGYSYMMNSLFEELDWNTTKGPHIAARAQRNRISIANSDAAARPSVAGAMDEALRAVHEQLTVATSEQGTDRLAASERRSH